MQGNFNINANPGAGNVYGASGQDNRVIRSDEGYKGANYLKNSNGHVVGFEINGKKYMLGKASLARANARNALEQTSHDYTKGEVDQLINLHIENLKNALITPEHPDYLPRSLNKRGFELQQHEMPSNNDYKGATYLKNAQGDTVGFESQGKKVGLVESYSEGVRNAPQVPFHRAVNSFIDNYTANAESNLEPLKDLDENYEPKAMLATPFKYAGNIEPLNPSKINYISKAMENTYKDILHVLNKFDGYMDHVQNLPESRSKQILMQILTRYDSHLTKELDNLKELNRATSKKFNELLRKKENFNTQTDIEPAINGIEHFKALLKQMKSSEDQMYKDFPNLLPRRSRPKVNAEGYLDSSVEKMRDILIDRKDLSFEINKLKNKFNSYLDLINNAEIDPSKKEEYKTRVEALNAHLTAIEYDLQDIAEVGKKVIRNKTPITASDHDNMVSTIMSSHAELKRIEHDNADLDSLMHRISLLNIE